MTRAQRHFANLQKLLKGHQYASYRVGEYMPLWVEWVGPHSISICHHGEQNGDLMRDPEVVFRIGKQVAMPELFRNDYTGVINECFTYNANGDPVGIRVAMQADIAHFCDLWFRNLKDQGFFDAEPVRFTDFETNEKEAI